MKAPAPITLEWVSDEELHRSALPAEVNHVLTPTLDACRDITRRSRVLMADAKRTPAVSDLIDDLKAMRKTLHESTAERLSVEQEHEYQALLRRWRSATSRGLAAPLGLPFAPLWGRSAAGLSIRELVKRRL